MHHTGAQPEWEFDELSPEFEFEFDGEGEEEVDALFEEEAPFSEAEEMELATELLSISSEEELDYFLGKVFKRIGRGLKKVGKVFRPLGRVLKSVAKKALPFVGGALGSFIPIPGVGTAIGSALGSAVSSALEMELEGVSEEDREFEMSRRFVRLAGIAAQQAARAAPNVHPLAAAQSAVRAATQRLQQGAGRGRASAGTRRSGRWIRRGGTIVLLGV
jgi:uncharacterized protein (DUF697 family)